MYVVAVDPGRWVLDQSGSPDRRYKEGLSMMVLSKMLKQELESTNQIQVVMTRTEDDNRQFKNPTEAERAMIAGKASAYILLSQHTGKHDRREWQDDDSGPEVYYSIFDSEGKEIAGQLSKAISKATGLPDRGAKSRSLLIDGKKKDFHEILRHTMEMGVPKAFMIQSAFHDNKRDVSLLHRETILRQIAIAQTKVICTMLKVPYGIYIEESRKMYLVRYKWSGLNNATDDGEIGRFYSITKAIETAIENPGCNVYEETGKRIYDHIEKHIPPINEEGKTLILGKPILTGADLLKYIRWYNERSGIDSSFVDIEFCERYILEGELEGVRGDIAFFQACFETDHFRFTMNPSCKFGNNFSYLIDPDTEEPLQFNSMECGIRAHIQHLKAVAGVSDTVQPCVDPLFETTPRGIISLWDDLKADPNLNIGWSFSKEYGIEILGLYDQAAVISTTEHQPNKTIQPETDYFEDFREKCRAIGITAFENSRPDDNVTVQELAEILQKWQ